MLKSSAAEFLAERSPVAAMRNIRDTENEKGFDERVWREMVEMGWTSLILEERHGGLDFGYTGLGQVFYQVGRHLTLSPLLTSVISSLWIQQVAEEDQQAALFPGIVQGDNLITLAHEETGRHEPTVNSTHIRKEGGEYKLRGLKKAVPFARAADQFLVTGLLDEKFVSALVPADSEGVSITSYTLMDSQQVGDVHFDEVVVHDSHMIHGCKKDFLSRLLPAAYMCLSAELSGIADESFERTVEYLKERKQFGVSIGSFQALQHRCAHMYCELEILRSMVLKGLQSLDQKDENVARIAFMTKAKACQVSQLVTNEAVQMFGGIGMTDDEDIGLFMKRAKTAQILFGDEGFHLDAFAKFCGF